VAGVKLPLALAELGLIETVSRGRTWHGAPVAMLWAVTALLISACGSGAQEPVAVPLIELVADQERYEGSDVRTRGTVEVFGDDPDALHYVIEDDRANRVQLLPNEGAKQFVGREVIVVGRFGFDDQAGRFIEIEGIEPRG
jgi:hypothetical protein